MSSAGVNCTNLITFCSGLGAGVGAGVGEGVGFGAGAAAVRRRDLTVASGRGGEGEEGEKCPLVPVHQGSKCSEKGAVHGKVLKLLSRF